MSDICRNCCADADVATAKACRRQSCGLSLLLTGPDRFRRKYQADLEDWLKPEVLYHAFTGEEDGYKLARVALLDPVHQASLLEKAEREWPARLQQIAEQRRQEKADSKKAVQQFVLGFNQ